MVTFIPDFVSDERRQWAEELDPLTRDLETEAEWTAVAEEYKKTHGEPPPGTLAQVADHIDYVAKVAGYDHVGIGGDFYGQSGDDLVARPRRRIPLSLSYRRTVTPWLERGKYRQADPRQPAAGVRADTEKVAQRLQAERPPSLMSFEE